MEVRLVAFHYIEERKFTDTQYFLALLDHLQVASLSWH